MDAPADWKAWTPRVPQGPKLQDFEADAISELQPSDAERVDAFWRAQAETARLMALEFGDQRGGILDWEDLEPDGRVLGSWMQGASDQLLGHEYDYPKMPDDNTEEMKSRPSVFVPGGICAPGMEARWREAGADDQILHWIQEGGYSIKVGDGGVGHFRKNGKLAIENSAELTVLVLDLLLKGSWELVLAQQLRNVLPLHLAPKPGSKTP